MAYNIVTASNKQIYGGKMEKQVPQSHKAINSPITSSLLILGQQAQFEGKKITLFVLKSKMSLTLKKTILLGFPMF